MFGENYCIVVNDAHWLLKPSSPRLGPAVNQSSGHSACKSPVRAFGLPDPARTTQRSMPCHVSAILTGILAAPRHFGPTNVTLRKVAISILL